MKLTVFLENDAGDFMVKSSSEAMNRDWFLMKLPVMLQDYEKANPGYRLTGFKVIFAKEEKK